MLAAAAGLAAAPRPRQFVVCSSQSVQEARNESEGRPAQTCWPPAQEHGGCSLPSHYTYRPERRVPLRAHLSLICTPTRQTVPSRRDVTTACDPNPSRSSGLRRPALPSIRHQSNPIVSLYPRRPAVTGVARARAVPNTSSLEARVHPSPLLTLNPPRRASARCPP